MCELHHVLLVWIRLKSWLIQGKSLLKSSRPLALLRHAPSAACGQNCNKIGGYGFKSLLRKSKLLNHSNHYTFNNAEYPIGSTCSTIAITEEYKCGKPNAINPKKMRLSYIYIYILVYHGLSGLPHPSSHLSEGSTMRKSRLAATQRFSRISWCINQGRSRWRQVETGGDR